MNFKTSYLQGDFLREIFGKEASLRLHVTCHQVLPEGAGYKIHAEFDCNDKVELAYIRRWLVKKAA